MNNAILLLGFNRVDYFGQTLAALQAKMGERRHGKKKSSPLLKPQHLKMSIMYCAIETGVLVAI